MSSKEESGGGLLALVGLGVIAGLVYLSQYPIWGISSVYFVIAVVVLTWLVTGVLSQMDINTEKSKLKTITDERNKFQSQANRLRAELDEVTTQLKDLDEKYEKEVAEGVNKGKSAALKAAIAEKDELERQISSLASQLTNASKNSQKAEASALKKQQTLQKDIDRLGAQLASEISQADDKYTTLETEHNATLGRLAEERSRTKEFIANRISEMSHDDIVDFINARLQVIRRAEMTGDAQSALIKLQSQIQSTFTENGLVDVNTLIEFDDNIFRINEYEAIIDLYMEKIKTVRQKSDIDEEDREEQIMSWRRLMDQEVAKMEGTA